VASGLGVSVGESRGCCYYCYRWVKVGVWRLFLLLKAHEKGLQGLRGALQDVLLPPRRERGDGPQVSGLDCCPGNNFVDELLDLLAAALIAAAAVSVSPTTGWDNGVSAGYPIPALVKTSTPPRRALEMGRGLSDAGPLR